MSNTPWRKENWDREDLHPLKINVLSPQRASPKFLQLFLSAADSLWTPRGVHQQLAQGGLNIPTCLLWEINEAFVTTMYPHRRLLMGPTIDRRSDYCSLLERKYRSVIWLKIVSGCRECLWGHSFQFSLAQRSRVIIRSCGIQMGCELKKKSLFHTQTG